jgi:hypothetical protein
VVEGKLSCRGSCQQEVVRERKLLAESERAVSQRTIIYDTSSKVYQRTFAFSATFSILALSFGCLLLLGGEPIFGAVLIGLGIVFGIHGLGMARAGKKFKALAAEGRNQGTQA